MTIKTLSSSKIVFLLKEWLGGLETNIRNFKLDTTRDADLRNIWVFTIAQITISCT